MFGQSSYVSQILFTYCLDTFTNGGFVTEFDNLAPYKRTQFLYNRVNQIQLLLKLLEKHNLG